MVDIVERLRATDASQKTRNDAADEIEQLRKSLKRCLNEALGWMDYAVGCAPEECMEDSSWADEARRLLSKNK